MPQFTLDINFSQIAIFNAALDRPFNDWTDDHFNQGFCWRPGSVSFRTAAREGLATITLDLAKKPALRDDVLVAIAVPYHVAEGKIEIASILKGEIHDVPAGDYELIYQTGKTGKQPWVALQFIPTTKPVEPRILKGAEYLKPPAKLIMTANPA